MHKAQDGLITCFSGIFLQNYLTAKILYLIRTCFGEHLSALWRHRLLRKRTLDLSPLLSQDIKVY